MVMVLRLFYRLSNKSVNEKLIKINNGLIYLFQFYSLDVYGRDRKPLNIKQLHKQLKWIVDNTKQTAPAVGILTMEHRHTWANTYNKLIKGKPIATIHCYPYNIETTWLRVYLCIFEIQWTLIITTVKKTVLL